MTENAATRERPIIITRCYARTAPKRNNQKASWHFAETGSSQVSVYTLYGFTADPNLKSLKLILNEASSRLRVVPGQTMAFEVLVAACSSAGSSAGYLIRGVIKNIAGATSLVGAPSTTALGEDIAAWDALAVADNANDALVVQVTGSATNIRWVAAARTLEVKFP